MFPRLRKLLLIPAVIIALLLVAMLVVPPFIPVELYKDKVIDKVEESTGRDLRINGDISLRLLPRVQLKLEDAYLGNPDGFAADSDMVALQELQISVGLWDLLHGRLAINTFRLVKPVITLARNSQGQPNWVFEPENPQAITEVEPATTQDAPSGNNSPPRITIPHVEIEEGTLSYQEAPDAEPLLLTHINARIKMPAADEQLTVYADTQLNDTLPVSADLRVNTLASWLAGEQTAYRIEVKADSDLLLFTAEGKASPMADDGSETLNVKGDMHLAIASLQRLSTKAGMAVMEDAPSEGKISLRSMFSYQGDRTNLHGTTLSIDDMSISGSGNVALGGPRPVITADLSTADTLVLDALLDRDTPSIDRSNDAAPETPEGQWSAEPLLTNTAALKAVDADVSLSLAGIKAHDLKVGAMRATASLSNGNLKLHVPAFTLYDGTANIELAVSPLDSQNIRLRKKASFEGVDIGRLLADANGFNKLSGKGNLSVDMTVQGVSVRDFVDSATGSGSFALANGAIKGFNLATILRDARNVVKSIKDKTITAEMGQSGDVAQTDFSSLTGSFRADSGTVSNSDLVLKAPLLDVTGDGTIGLPDRRVDYRLRPTIVGSLEGENRTQQTSGGVTIPLRVSGSFEQLRFSPDASALVQDAVKDPEAALKNVEDNVRGLRDDLKSLFR